MPPANKKEIVAYAYLRKDMPFKYRFNRSKLPFVFNGSNVASWNLLDGGTHPDVLKQVRLLDYVGPDSFVLEFHTRSAADRLILAKTPPGPTLKQTIDTVEKTLDIKGDTLSDTNMLVVPVLDFDLTKRYRQLENRRILAPASARRLDMRLFAARQRIEFRLDESGAELESEAYLSAGGVPEAGAAFLFDKPFLILIQRRGSPRPYFAAWIANADLMPRMPHATTTGSPGAATMNDKVHEMAEPNPSAEGIQRPSPNIMPAYLHPLRILHKSTPLYPPAGKAMGLNGSVVCQVLVSEDGHVQRARVLHSTDPIFNKAALDAARQFVFSQPTTPGGRRVKALQLLIFKFNQQRKETTGTKRKIPEAPTVN